MVYFKNVSSARRSVTSLNVHVYLKKNMIENCSQRFRLHVILFYKYGVYKTNSSPMCIFR